MIEIVCVPVIVAIVYALMSIYKTYIAKDNEKLIRFIPLIGGGIGIILGIVFYFAFPQLIVATNVVTAIGVGLARGQAGTGSDRICKQLTKYGINVRKEVEKDDKSGNKE